MVKPAVAGTVWPVDCSKTQNKINDEEKKINFTKESSTVYTNGRINENFDSIKEISGRNTGIDQCLKDVADIRAFNNAISI